MRGGCSSFGPEETSYIFPGEENQLESGVLSPGEVRSTPNLHESEYNQETLIPDSERKEISLTKNEKVVSQSQCQYHVADSSSQIQNHELENSITVCDVKTEQSFEVALSQLGQECLFVCLFVDSANKGHATCTEISTDDQVSGNEKASEADV